MKSSNEAILLILVGIAGVLIGIFNKTFYASKGINAAVGSDKQVPRWQGRLFFILIGGMFPFFGIYDLVSKFISE